MKKIFFILFPFLSLTSFSQEVKVLDCDTCVYDLVALEDPPEFPGGNDAMTKFIISNIKYPSFSKENGIQGKVFITFIIDTMGNLTNIKVFKGITIPKDLQDEKKIATYNKGAAELSEESLRVVRIMPKWSYGKVNGRSVRVRFILPFNFKLD